MYKEPVLIPQNHPQKTNQFNEAFFRTLIENTLDLIIILKQDGTSIFESPSVFRILGYEPGEQPDQHFSQFVHPDDLPEVTKVFNQILQHPQGTAAMELRVRHQNGSWRVLESVAKNLLDDPIVAGIVVNARDITERKRVEQALRESEARYRTIVEDQTELICRFSLMGLLTFVNEAYCRFFKQSYQVALAQDFLIFTAEADKAATRAYLNSFKQGQVIGTLEHRVILPHHDNEIRWLQWHSRAVSDEHGQIIEIQSVGRDITGRRRVEVALEQVEQRYRHLFDEAPALYIITHDHDGIPLIIDCNERCLTTLGYTWAELQNRPLTDCYSKKSRAHWLNNDSYQRTLAGEVVIEAQELVTRKGRVIQTMMQATPETDPNGMIIGTLAMYIDISERKQLEAENAHLLAESERRAAQLALLYESLQDQMEVLRQTQNQLVQSEKLAALGRLSAAIAHEINNPLQAIQNAMILFKEERQHLSAKGDLDYSMGIIELEIERIANMIRRMQNFYRPTRKAEQISPSGVAAISEFYQSSTGELESIALGPMLSDLLQLTAHQSAQGKVVVKFESSDNLPLIRGNPDHLKQVFLNLILNAIESMDTTGGTLQVTLTSTQFQTTSGQFRAGVRLDFNDTGSGIPPEILPRLFEPFFSTKTQGSGLGLFISYKIIEAHLGQISVESQVGLGTTFTIFLPAKPF